MPVGYLYARRATYEKAGTDPLIAQLRRELYVEEYEAIPWGSHQHTINKLDEYYPHTWVLKLLVSLMNVYEMCPMGWLRKLVHHAMRPAVIIELTDISSVVGSGFLLQRSSLRGLLQQLRMPWPS